MDWVRDRERERVRITDPGPHRVAVFDMQGRRIALYRGIPDSEVRFRIRGPLASKSKTPIRPLAVYSQRMGKRE